MSVANRWSRWFDACQECPFKWVHQVSIKIAVQAQRRQQVMQVTVENGVRPPDG